MRWLLLISLVACECDSSDVATEAETETETEVEAEAEETETETAAETEGETEASDALATLGMTLPVATVSSEARTANQAALEKHAAGDYEASRDGFLQALAETSTYDAARFNLACAYGRLGEHAAALRELTQLLQRDLPRYRAKLDDEDLAATLATPEGSELTETIDTLSGQWTDAERGLLSLTRGRVGFYLADHSRFFPLTTRDIDVAPSVNREHRSVSWLTTDSADGHDAWFGIVAVHTETFAPNSEYSWMRTHYNPGSSEVWDFIDASTSPVRFQVDDRWEELRGRRLVESANQSERALSAYEQPPEGYALRGNRLVIPEGEPIELERGHGVAKWHSFAFNNARTRAFVASEMETEPEFEGFELYLRHHKTVFDHVNLETREVTRLGRGDSAGYVFAFEGAAYVVGLDGSRVHPTFEPSEHEALPVTPLPPSDR